MAAAAKSNTNWFAIGISAAVVVVLVALGGLVVFLNNQATSPGTAPKSAIVNEETGAITFGTGDTEIDTFVDFMCPICGDFEDTYGAALQDAAANDDITLNLHPISILDRYSQNTEFSTRAAASVYCVAAEAPDSTLDYFNLLFENQPAENTPGLSDEELAAFADQVGAGAAADCIADGTYKRFVTSQTNQHDIQGTPTVEIDGERIENSEIGTRLADILG
ncbi:thioredoxin domain-containing protein [Microbacterium sp. YMB-B2]|uniref:Thioredoxin domain-containing protein n=1 Tax=Microbacterium tenebrionis TaxID=2830665 RepID=A0A9X1LLN0_9MICO|nr:thioredoxin domain-containing protein [Microbacterium tenebrionis]MCC2027955.1 thioredoxin domain-containing protein [Microbacterium tenebrionis]